MINYSKEYKNFGTNYCFIVLKMSSYIDISPNEKPSETQDKVATMRETYYVVFETKLSFVQPVGWIGKSEKSSAHFSLRYDIYYFLYHY